MFSRLDGRSHQRWLSGQGKLGAVITVPASCSPCQEDGGEGGGKRLVIFSDPEYKKQHHLEGVFF